MKNTTYRLISLLLLFATLLSLLSLPALALEDGAEGAPEALSEEAAPEETTSEETLSEDPVPEEAAPEEPISEETAPEEETAAPLAPEDYTYGGYQAPNLFGDELPDFFLDEENWNVLDHGSVGDTIVSSTISGETLMAQAESDLTEASLEAQSEGYDYEEELARFPESYQVYLRQLHQVYPNWVFIAVDTGLTWEEAIEGELGGASTIDYNLGPNSITHHLLLNNRGSYYDEDKYSSTNGYKPIDGSHVSCSRAALGYYMDPRNFLMDKYIFQFEDQAYSPVQQLEGVQKILKNARSAADGLYHVTTYITTAGKERDLADLESSYGADYSTIFYRAGMAAGVSPYYLASKCAQETGARITNPSICGTYEGYTGIYNFYNIGAYASTTGQAVANGLKYAKNAGWTNPILAVKGGADFLAKSYISKGQNTGYYMRFNVAPGASYSTYTHQYMSATYAVASEAMKTFSGYVAAEAESEGFLFYIPVYDNMPDQDSVVSLTPTTKGTVTSAYKLLSEPSPGSDTLVSTVPAGTSVTVLGGSVTQYDNYLSRLYYPYWYKVKVTLSGKSYTGWLPEQYVDLSANYTLKKGATQSLSSIRSTEGNVGTLYYESSDPTVATVSDSGVITAVANGSCKIYVLSTGGSFDAIGVKVSSSGSSGSSSAGKPATPDLISAESLASGGVKVVWGSVPDAEGYTVWRKKENGSYGKIKELSSATATSFVDTDVISGQVYTYTVRAFHSGGQSGYDADGISLYYLAPPVLSAIQRGNAGIVLTWETVPGADSYQVWRKDGIDWKKLDTVTATSFTDRTMTSGQSHSYTVQALYGDLTSGYGKNILSSFWLSAPTLTQAKADSSGITLSWAPVEGADQYTVWRRLPSESSWTRLGAVTGETTSYLDKSVTGGLTYYYTAVALGGGLSSSFDRTGLSAKALISTAALTTPTLKSLSVTSSGLKVSWDKVAGATGYTVWRKTTGSWQRIAVLTSGSTTSYEDTTVKSGTKYAYTVRAQGNAPQSDYNRTGLSALFLSPPALKSAAVTGSSITVSWNAVNGATGYTVWRKTTGSWTRIATLSSGSTTSYKDGSDLKAGTKYFYTVRAQGTGGQSDYDRTGISATATAGASGGTSSTALATPTLKSLSVTASGLKVSWDKVTGATGYTVWRKTTSSWQRIAVLTNGSTTSYEDTTVKSGTKYTYTVRAQGNAPQSDYNRTGLSALFLSPPALKSAAAASGAITVSWNKVDGATGYTVWRKVSGGSWAKIATLSGGSTTSYKDGSDLKAGTKYFYTVRAQGTGGQSDYDRTGVSATAAGSSSGEKLVTYVTTGNINYRTGPGTSYSLAGTFAPGVSVQVVEGESYDVNGTPWFKIKVDGKYYYISSRYLKKA